MDKGKFRDILRSKRLILDGATGSNLIKRGNMPSGVCPEQWILDHPDVLIGLQEDYLLAGSNIVYTPTFTANRIKLSEYGLDGNVESVNCRLADLSRRAIERVKQKKGDGIYLMAGDLTMTGKQLRPMGTMDTDELIDVYAQQITALMKSGVDLLVVETMMSLQECRCALIAAKEIGCDLPVMVTMTFEESGRALFGTDPLAALVTLSSLGADAVGVNCGAGPDTMLDIVKIFTDNSDTPVIVKPNAGLPSLLPDGTTVYSMSPEEFVNSMKPILQTGVSLVGGCCGTAPEYISALSAACNEIEYRPSFIDRGLKSRGYFYLSSERKTCVFNLDSSFMIVGERINPTGKKALQAELRDGCFDMVRDFASAQEECGAALLDVNMGMSGIDEKETMIKAVEEVTQVTDLPLVIDSSDPEVMEAALRRYPGRALVNSVSLEEVKIKKMLPLVKKYGAMMILLPLSDEGLPDSIERKHEIINIVAEEAHKIGLDNSDLVVDGLVATVGANKNAALETLATIRYCRDELKLPTICGLSNISFGLPQRSFVNSAFLTMAIAGGLTMAISNPNQLLLTNTAFACDLLRNKEGADLRYIEHVSKFEEEAKSAAPVVNASKQASLERKQETAGPEGTVGQIMDAVVKGSKDKGVSLTQKALEEGIAARVILDEALLPAIDKVGSYFDSGKYFLPQLIAGAQAMEKCIEVIEPKLAEDADPNATPGKIVIATVKGDIHDIGKNLVALMLKNNGFTVIDLGKDVSKEEIVETAIREEADIIALSALMTTTMKEMQEVVDYAKEKGCRSVIMIGGAVITQEYSDDIGAGGYSEDAAQAVKLAQSIMKRFNKDKS